MAAHLEAVEVLRLEVVGGAAAPVHDVLVLTLAAQLAVPVGDAQVVVHHGVAVGAVLQDRVEEGLRGREGPGSRPRQSPSTGLGWGPSQGPPDSEGTLLQTQLFSLQMELVPCRPSQSTLEVLSRVAFCLAVTALFL